MTSEVLHVFAAPQYESQIRDLAYKYDVKISNFTAASPASSVSNFPLLDPTVIEAFTQATVIIGTASAGVHFVRELLELVKAASGAVQVIDPKTRKALQRK